VIVDELEDLTGVLLPWQRLGDGIGYATGDTWIKAVNHHGPEIPYESAEFGTRCGLIKIGLTGNYVLVQL
jgi:hypothetical protein